MSLTGAVGAIGYPPQLSIGQGNPEALKYGKLWERPEYRAVAPGELLAQTFLDQAKPRAGSHVIDFGCGTGRGALMLALLGGCRVTMVDFVRNCLDPDVRDALTTQAHALTFVKADLERPLPVVAEYGYCFPAGTIVAGAGESIDNLSAGGTIVNRRGVRQEIRKTFKRIYTGDMIRLRMGCVPDVLVTPEHRILVSSIRRVHRRSTYGGKKSRYEWVPSKPAWKDASAIQSGDWVIVPRIAESESASIHFRLAGGGQGRREVTTYIEHIVDEGTAWLLGLYVAEGNITDGRITLSLNAKETDLAGRAVAEFSRLGVVARFRRSPSIQVQNGLRVVADSVGLASVLDEWCGHGAPRKCVPVSIMYAHARVVRSFIMGVVDGDGCLRKDRRNRRFYYSVTTVSRQLAFDLLALLHKLGVHASMANPDSQRTSYIRGRAIVSRHPAYTVQWSKRSWDRTEDAVGRAPYGAARFVGGSVYLPVRGVQREPVRHLPVFNIQTEDHTYGVPFTVHNCTDVLEHIPPDKVDQVIEHVLMAAPHVFFSISTTEDACGGLIGETLHLSQHPSSWWLDKLREHDCLIHWFHDGGLQCHAYVTGWKDAQKIVDDGVLNTTDEQIRANVKANIEHGWQQAIPHEANDLEVMIVGGGPSLAQFEEDIKAKRAAGVKLITLNGAYNWALEHGLTPSATCIVDARPFNARFTKPVVDDCKYLIASQCDPSVLKGLPKDRTYLFHTMTDMITDILSGFYPAWYPIPGGSTVLLRVIPLMRMLGYRKFHLYGCDSCLSEDQAHHAYAQPENDSRMVVPIMVTGGRVFHCHLWMAAQAQEMISLIKAIGDEIELAIYGDGLLAHIIHTGAEMAIGDEQEIASFCQ